MYDSKTECRKQRVEARVKDEYSVLSFDIWFAYIKPVDFSGASKIGVVIDPIHKARTPGFSRVNIALFCCFRSEENICFVFFLSFLLSCKRVREEINRIL